MPSITSAREIPNWPHSFPSHHGDGRFPPPGEAPPPPGPTPGSTGTASLETPVSHHRFTPHLGISDPQLPNAPPVSSPDTDKAALMLGVASALTVLGVIMIVSLGCFAVRLSRRSSLADAFDAAPTSVAAEDHVLKMLFSPMRLGRARDGDADGMGQGPGSDGSHTGSSAYTHGNNKTLHRMMIESDEELDSAGHDVGFRASSHGGGIVRSHSLAVPPSAFAGAPWSFYHDSHHHAAGPYLQHHHDASMRVACSPGSDTRHDFSSGSNTIVEEPIHSPCASDSHGHGHEHGDGAAAAPPPPPPALHAINTTRTHRPSTTTSMSSASETTYSPLSPLSVVNGAFAFDKPSMYFGGGNIAYEAPAYEGSPASSLPTSPVGPAWPAPSAAAAAAAAAGGIQLPPASLPLQHARKHPTSKHLIERPATSLGVWNGGCAQAVGLADSGRRLESTGYYGRAGGGGQMIQPHRTSTAPASAESGLGGNQPERPLSWNGSPSAPRGFTVDAVILGGETEEAHRSD
ncbi:hypothetical protein V8E36_001254 [Tilletia maclaganii]